MAIPGEEALTTAAHRSLTREVTITAGVSRGTTRSRRNNIPSPATPTLTPDDPLITTTVVKGPAVVDIPAADRIIMALGIRVDMVGIRKDEDVYT